MITRQEIVLAIMGGIFVVETLSVMIQTTYFRLTHGKRVFLMAPDSPSLRAQRLEGDAGGGAVLDHHVCPGAHRSVYP